MRSFTPARVLALVLSLFVIALLLPWPLAWAEPAAPIPQSATERPTVATRSYSNARLGVITTETTLDTSNVNSASFGKLFSLDVDGQVYAEPLYLPAITVPGKGVHNVVYVATQHNSVYAFDADDPTQTAPLWTTNLGPSAPTPNPDFGNRYNGAYKDIYPEVGITSTPVIDVASGTLYVLPFIKKNGGYLHRLHALDLATGQDKTGSPVTLAASVPGTGVDGNIDNDPNLVTFDSKQQLQRPALTLSNGVIYLAFAGYADTNPYHGWVLAYDATTLQQRAAFNTTPDANPSDTNQGEGGIWMSGQGITVDTDGDLYVVVGNGTFYDPSGGKQGYGNAILRLRLVGNAFQVISWFEPYNYSSLNSQDNDLGVGGVVLWPLPGPNGHRLVLSGSKQGKLYVANRDALGGLCSSCTSPNGDTNVDQWFQATTGRHIHGTPVYWNSPAGPNLYMWGENDKIKAFRFDLNTGKFNTTPVSSGSLVLPNGMPGGILTVSANGGNAGSGIVWASHVITGNANQTPQPGVLQAFNAENLSQELWSSTQVPGRDGLDYFVKFNPPLVANGKVYLPTYASTANPDQFSNKLVVYGLLRSFVTKNADDGDIGSLSYALSSVGPDEPIIFKLTGGNVISVPRTLTMRPGQVLAGGCPDGVPGIILKTTGSGGLVLKGGNNLSGFALQATGTALQALTPTGGSNRLSCLRLGRSTPG